MTTLVQAAPASANPVPPAPSVAIPTAASNVSPAAPSTAVTTGAQPAATSTTSTQTNSVTDNGGVGVREFQGDEVGQVLRLLARQAKINMVVSEEVKGQVTMRLEDVTALQAIAIIVKAKDLLMDPIDNVYYIKTAAERAAEPTESGSYQFSYAQVAMPATTGPLASTLGTTGATKDTSGSISSTSTINTDLLKLIKSQLQSKIDPEFDLRTNTVFFRETRSNIDNIRKILVQIDKPTRQVMIEARLVEVSANPKQAYGINWAGVVGSADSPQTISYGTSAGGFSLPSSNNDVIGNFSKLAAGTFAILSAPQLSITLQALNEDSDAEFLANPRIVTADNLAAKIEIVQNQPVPQLNFNEQTATAVFGGFQDKIFGNTLLVKPSINKDDFITLAVKPIISNKVRDEPFTFAGATVRSPVIDTRTLDSNVLIKSGDTLAIGGLLQDEVNKGRTKVPVMGDIPILGYFFQSRTNVRAKRNLLVFVTPTILEQHYGTGLEDQVSGLHNSGEEFADPNGWRNNAKGAVRLVPTSNRQLATDYPKPGIAPAPTKLRFMSTAKDRDF